MWEIKIDVRDVEETSMMFFDSTFKLFYLTLLVPTMGHNFLPIATENSHIARQQAEYSVIAAEDKGIFVVLTIK